MSGAEARLRVALLGVGIMGAPMARNLLRAGFETTVWNRTPEKLAALAAEGARVSESAAGAARGADLVIFMVSTGAVVDDLLFGKPGVAAALDAGAIVTVMSSIPVDAAQRQAAALAERGIGYLDAPVSGGERGAIAGSLTIMVGGEEDVLSRARPALEAMGRVTHVGPIGAGQLAKLANQLIVGVTIGAVAEAALLIEAGGGDLRQTLAALQGGFADSAILRQHGARMLARDFKPGAYAHVQLKDLSTALDQATATGAALPFTQLATDLYARMCAAGLAEIDHSGLFLFLEERAKTAG